MVFTVCLMSLALTQQGEPRPIWSPGIVSTSPVARVHWDVSYPKVATLQDSLWIASRIWSERNAVVPSIQPGNQLPVVRIRARGPYAAPVREFPLDFDQLDSMSWNKNTGKTNSWDLIDRKTLALHQFRVDLRRLEFPWHEGDYDVQIAFPNLQLETSQGRLQPKWGYQSKVMTIQVRNCLPETEERTDTRWLSEPGDLPEKIARLSDRLVTFTNRSELPISIRVDDTNRPGKEYYRAYLQLAKWHCKGKWDLILGDAALVENRTMLTVDPGESVKLIAPDWYIDGAGYYRYRLMGYYSNQPDPPKYGGVKVLATEPFLVGLPERN